MIKEAIDRIIQLAQPPTFSAQGRTYYTGTGHPLKEPLPPTESFASLDGLVGFVRLEECVDFFLHVESPTRVRLCEPLAEPWLERPVPAVATFAEGTKFPFGEFLSQSDFMIRAQVGFADGGHRDDLLRLVGRLEDNRVVTAEDDGIKQRVTAATGVARVGDVEVPNPVTLYPYRTFAEVAQPPMLCVVRVQPGHRDDVPEVALFPVEDASWARAARLAIKAYLESQLEGARVLA